MSYKVDIPYSELNPFQRHINEFFKLSCASDLIEKKLFPNAKEITESMAAYEAVRKYVYHKEDFRFDDPSITLVAVGDGHTPRTGALFAFRTAWKCYSIDPVLRMKDYKIDRLELINKKVEDIQPIVGDKMVVVAVHSHADLRDVEKKVISTTGNRSFISIPCCVKQELDYIKDYEYTDRGIWSTKNTVKVWLLDKYI
jgi:hypothetical protein